LQSSVLQNGVRTRRNNRVVKVVEPKYLWSNYIKHRVPLAGTCRVPKITGPLFWFLSGAVNLKEERIQQYSGVAWRGVAWRGVGKLRPSDCPIFVNWTLSRPVALMTFIETACSACHVPPAPLCVALITLTLEKASCSAGSPSVCSCRFQKHVTAFTLDNPVPHKSVVFRYLNHGYVLCRQIGEGTNRGPTKTRARCWATPLATPPSGGPT